MIAAIISEYNPFHNGHCYHIQKTREYGAEYIIALMSGSVVQRGDIAIFSAHERAVNAIKGGADLVLELPAQISLAPARDFALGSVKILKRLGAVDLLSFGTEQPDIETLSGLSQTILENEMKIKSETATGKTYPQAVSSVIGDLSDVLSGQNNTLAVEYLRALGVLGSKIRPFAVKRTSLHDSKEPSGKYASASYIRELLKNGESAEIYSENLAAKESPAFIENAERAILFKLSGMSLDDFLRLPYCGELAPRLYRASRRACSLEKIYNAAKSRNFTLSKLRRAVISAAIGLKESDLFEPEFVRILALNSKGAKILRELEKCSEITLGGALSKLYKLSPRAQRQAELTELASRLRSLGCPGKISDTSEFCKSPIFVDNE